MSDSVLQEHGLRCPSCSRDDRLEVVVTKWVLLVPDGTGDATDGSEEWDDQSPCRCTGCAWRGVVLQAKPPQLPDGGQVSDHEVAQWVRQYYQLNFDALDATAKNNYRQRYAAAHGRVH